MVALSGVCTNASVRVELAHVEVIYLKPGRFPKPEDNNRR